VVRKAAEISPLPFIVTEGLRTLARQKELVARGASKTLRSRHLTGHAIDFVVQVGAKGISYKMDDMKRVGQVMKQAALLCNVRVVWGGDLKNFVDNPHVELSRTEYPRF
jgi:peptidoglycan L-alanyl-D-glutamate endopeptidase CwlK